MEIGPKFIDVTYHREEYLLKPLADGTFKRIYTQKRPGTVIISAVIQNRYKVDAVPHLICGGFTREETEEALIEMAFIGIDNVLALRGDNVKGQNTFEPEKGGNVNALELVKQIREMNRGNYLDEDLVNPFPTNFCVGVAGYPEKHSDAPNMKSDLAFLKQKMDSGADYIVTQMFFNNAKYFEYVEQCRQLGIEKPVIPGLKPLTSKNQLFTLSKIFHIDIPEALADEVLQCKNDKEVAQVGIQWSIQQAKELKKAGVPVLHFYTMGKSAATLAIAREVF